MAFWDYQPIVRVRKLEGAHRPRKARCQAA